VEERFAGQGESLSARNGNVVLCDFDGTITVQDTAEWILEKYADGDWHELDDRYGRGEISLLACMREQFALVKAERSAILDELEKNIVLRKGFPSLVDVCIENDSKVMIVSAGLDFVIQHFLRRLGVMNNVSIYSASTFDDDGHISFKFPPLVIAGAKTFKDDLVLQNKKKGNKVIYFGDGMPDTEACALSDHRFAVKGRRLESELIKRRLPFFSFEQFLEVIPMLESILNK
jgi:2-hydroxy-3-keto-5-methylthiopentenyl-1-phosphate phosphatase